MEDNLKILLIEDNQSDVELIQRELKKYRLNFTLELVETRLKYENALRNFTPDIILSDYSLPSFDGLTAFHIKQRLFQDIPFIMVSGTIGEERAVELIKNGITDYTLKDKLYTLYPKIVRGLKEAKESKEKRISDEKIRTQYEKLLEIAFLQSHQVRVPIANILGLFNLFKFDCPADPINSQVLLELKTVAEVLDKVIHEIVKKTSEIEGKTENNLQEKRGNDNEIKTPFFSFNPSLML
jgi:CheY-like chemotaxis protein